MSRLLFAQVDGRKGGRNRWRKKKCFFHPSFETTKLTNPSGANHPTRVFAQPTVLCISLAGLSKQMWDAWSRSGFVGRVCVAWFVWSCSIRFRKGLHVTANNMSFFNPKDQAAFCYVEGRKWGRKREVVFPIPVLNHRPSGANYHTWGACVAKWIMCPTHNPKVTSLSPACVNVLWPWARYFILIAYGGMGCGWMFVSMLQYWRWLSWCLQIALSV